MDRVVYCNRWHRTKRKPAGTLSESEAKERYAKREAFCAVVLDADGRPCGFIEVGPDSFGVGFLDAELQQDLDYAFDEIGGRLFLSQAIYWDAAADSSLEQKTHFFFKPDGSGTAHRIVGAVAIGRSLDPTDVSKNWEPRPEFEDIPSLLRRNRS